MNYPCRNPTGFSIQFRSELPPEKAWPHHPYGQRYWHGSFHYLTDLEVGLGMSVLKADGTRCLAEVLQSVPTPREPSEFKFIGVPKYL